MNERLQIAGLALIVGLACLEILILKLSRKNFIIDLKNWISNLSIGIGERFTDLFLAPYIYLLFKFLQQNYGLFAIRTNWWSFILLIFVTDFIWYWYHRLSHRVNILWAAHIVHHQSPDYNLTVAARITFFQTLIRTVFWSVLALVGFAPDEILGVLLLHGSYSFFTHTQLGKKLHFLEGVLITPSLHGVHHASNAQYIDKNYGDIFVFWDKLFGTFAKEDETPRYGLTKPFTSHSFLWQHFHYFAELFIAVKSEKNKLSRLKIIFGPPDSLNSSYRTVLEEKYIQAANRILPLHLKFYIILQTIASLLVLLAATYYRRFINLETGIALFALLFLSLINIGAIMEKKRYLLYIELARVLVLFFLLFCIQASKGA